MENKLEVLRSIKILLFIIIFCSLKIYGQNDTINNRLTEKVLNKSFKELFSEDNYINLDFSRQEIIDSLLNAGWHIPNPYLITHKDELMLTIYGKPSNDIIIGEWELYYKKGDRYKPLLQSDIQLKWYRVHNFA